MLRSTKGQEDGCLTCLTEFIYVFVLILVMILKINNPITAFVIATPFAVLLLYSLTFKNIEEVKLRIFASIAAWLAIAAFFWL